VPSIRSAAGELVSVCLLPLKICSYRRGKPFSNDIDIIMTHQTAGQEKYVLGKLVTALERDSPSYVRGNRWLTSADRYPGKEPLPDQHMVQASAGRAKLPYVSASFDFNPPNGPQHGNGPPRQVLCGVPSASAWIPAANPPARRLDLRALEVLLDRCRGLDWVHAVRTGPSDTCRRVRLSL
jgi:hypothetical protein